MFRPPIVCASRTNSRRCCWSCDSSGRASILAPSIYSVIVENLPDSSLVKRIAYVDANAEHLFERAEFAELAANKLGLRARVFRTVADADKWLSD